MAKLSDGDKNLPKRNSNAPADSTVEHMGDLIKQAPVLGLTYRPFTNLTGTATEMRKQRVYEFMEAIVDRPDVFTPGILETETLQDGFANALQQYITMCIERKWQVVRASFEDFG